MFSIFFALPVHPVASENTLPTWKCVVLRLEKVNLENGRSSNKTLALDLNVCAVVGKKSL
jgi:hypothetical protein